MRADVEPGDDGYPTEAILADRIHSALTDLLGSCPEVDGQPACFAAAEAAFDPSTSDGVHVAVERQRSHGRTCVVPPGAAS